MLKVTCSILCYNYGRFLTQAIESCLNQQRGNYALEIIVIDDGSTDETPDICQKYTDKIITYRSENEGFASSLTKAVNYATGDIVCILDADDYFLPNKIITVVEEFYKNPEVLFVFHDQAIVDENGRITNPYFKGGNSSTHVFRRIPAKDLLVAHNEQFFYTMYWLGKGRHVPKVLGHYRKHSTGMSRPKKLLEWKRKLVLMNVLHLKKLRELRETVPIWTTKKQIQNVYHLVASGYNFLKMEIALNRNDKLYALKCFGRILYFDFKRNKFEYRNLKLFVSTFFLGRFKRY